MKLLYHKQSLPDRKIYLTVDIIVEEIESDHGISASYVTHPENIKRRKRLSEAKLVILNDVVASAVNSIKSRGFQILKFYQSKKDYSYYIEFLPVVVDEDTPTDTSAVVVIKFRISQHKSRSIDNDDGTTSILRIKSFQLGGKNFENSIDLILAFDRICEELKKGNMGVLDEY